LPSRYSITCALPPQLPSRTLRRTPA
jgi:hypothetical protein